MKKIGLIAGGGRFPVMFAQEAGRLGYQVAVLGIEGTTSPELEKIAHSTDYFRLGQLSRPIELFKSAGIKQAVMAGSVPHVYALGKIMPDLKTAKVLLKLKDRRAQSILRAIADEFASEGIELINSATFLEHLLPEPGFIAGSEVSRQQKKNIALGWKTAKTLSGLDVGLTVVVRDCAVIAVEAMEGTDACIKRAGEIFKKFRVENSSECGMTVVKVARPEQDMRFDLPVAGSDTIKAMRSAGADMLAVEAKKTLILDKEKFAAEAKSAGITVIALKDGEI